MKNSFRELHRDFLLLPNAWDAGSARYFESLGAKAIATTSAGVAWSRGYPDGGALPPELQLATAREIARVIRVPLSVDLEGGYSDDPAAVAQLVARLLEIGVVGINLEDGAASPELLCAKIEAVKKAAAQRGIDLFVNARTDVYLRDLAPTETAVAEVLRRAELYRAAGCDGIFVPGLSGEAAIEAIAAAVAPLPLNLLLGPGLAPVEVLRRQGVKRLSAGSAIAGAALGHAGQLASDFLAGSSEQMFATAAAYGATNQLFANLQPRSIASSAVSTTSV